MTHQVNKKLLSDQQFCSDAQASVGPSTPNIKFARIRSDRKIQPFQPHWSICTLKSAVVSEACRFQELRASKCKQWWVRSMRDSDQDKCGAFRASVVGAAAPTCSATRDEGAGTKRNDKT